MVILLANTGPLSVVRCNYTVLPCIDDSLSRAVHQSPWWLLPSNKNNKYNISEWSYCLQTLVLSVWSGVTVVLPCIDDSLSRAVHQSPWWLLPSNKNNKYNISEWSYCLQTLVLSVWSGVTVVLPCIDDSLSRAVHQSPWWLLPSNKNNKYNISEWSYYLQTLVLSV